MYIPNDGRATRKAIEGEPFDAWIQLPDVRRNALTPYGARSVRDLRVHDLGDDLFAHKGVPRWPGRASIFANKSDYGWGLGADDPIALDALFWGKALVAAIATFSGLYVISKI